MERGLISYSGTLQEFKSYIDEICGDAIDQLLMMEDINDYDYLSMVDNKYEY